MKALPSDATDEDILSAIREWVEMLAANRYRDAYSWLYHPVGDHWSPERIETVVNNYGVLPPADDDRAAMRRRLRLPVRPATEQPEPLFRVTSPGRAQTRAVEPTFEVYRFPERTYGDGPIANVDFDLPLNDEWSDVTAQFLVLRSGKRLVFQLRDIHVV
jgi:hypothetical protein